MLKESSKKIRKGEKRNLSECDFILSSNHYFLRYDQPLLFDQHERPN